MTLAWSPDFMMPGIMAKGARISVPSALTLGSAGE
jgi:hypothetical protein